MGNFTEKSRSIHVSATWESDNLVININYRRDSSSGLVGSVTGTVTTAGEDRQRVGIVSVTNRDGHIRYTMQDVEQEYADEVGTALREIVNTINNQEDNHGQ